MVVFSVCNLFGLCKDFMQKNVQGECKKANLLVVIMLDLQSPSCLMGTYGIHAMLFHCDFYAFLANLGDYDRAELCGEGCCAVDGGG